MTIEHKPALVAQAWHDITCPEGPDCRDRPLHSAAQTVANTGHLALFLARLEVLEDETCPHTDTWFDRTICPEPCGSMHQRCRACGKTDDHCCWEGRDS